MIRPYPPGTAPTEDDIARNLRGEIPQPIPVRLPGQSQPVPPMAGGGIDPGPPTELPGGMKPPTAPPAAPNIKPPADDEEEPSLGRRFLRALGQGAGILQEIGDNNRPYSFRRE